LRVNVDFSAALDRVLSVWRGAVSSDAKDHAVRAGFFVRF
jgi:hypothetical protein